MMNRPTSALAAFSVAALSLLVNACGGGGSTGNERDSGTEKTRLVVEASDADGDTLSYQWRVTAGTVENRNARETTWTLPQGPGLHFAYVIVSDGRGGYAEQQYAVSTDALGTTAPATTPVSRTVTFSGNDALVASRVRVRLEDRTFVPEGGGGPAVQRFIYLPSVRIELRNGTSVVFAGETDEAGELLVPPLSGSLDIHCATSRGDTLAQCGAFPTGSSTTIVVDDNVPASHNLRVHGHVAFADGGICGIRNQFAGLRSGGTAQVVDATGAAVSATVGINRYGDYAIDAPVLVDASGLQLRVRCDGLVRDFPISNTSWISSNAVEVSVTLPNSRPLITRMVASGPEGNVRGRMIDPEAGVSSNGLPSADHFLTYKGQDTRQGACQYYKSFGAVEDCTPQGGFINPMSLDDWKRQHGFQPYGPATQTEVQATYINKWDLNLLRRMAATQASANNIAFVVCNSPGPEGTSQREIDQVVATGPRGERLVACVAMEWSVTNGVNGNLPFTKFLTFGPDGALIPSVNLDGRGEKFMPGACVACHGATRYAGKFPDAASANASPNLGSGFLPFDTGNYLFASSSGLQKSDQQAAFKGLNDLVKETERNQTNSPVRRLIDGWYAPLPGTSANAPAALNERYVPDSWLALGTDATDLYRGFIAPSCRTCHGAFRGFDWDSEPSRVLELDKRPHVCGGGPDLAVNASMPNALISRDRAFQAVQSSTELQRLMNQFFGCSATLPDPAYARR